MSDHDNCPNCGGNDGNHYDDCFMDGTDSNYSSYEPSSGTNISAKKWWILYLVAMIIGTLFNEFIGVLMLLGLVFWLAVN